MIAEFIAKNNIKPADCAYHTNRSVEGKGSVRVLVLKSDNIARCDYTCPECGHKGYSEKPWKRPFSVSCEKCSRRITVPKLRDQIKKERKSGK